jgi:CRP-like cAMP-binding protein
VATLEAISFVTSPASPARILDLLRSSPLFETLESEALEELAVAVRPVRLEPGDAVGEIHVLSGGRRTATVVAAIPSELS